MHYPLTNIAVWILGFILHFTMWRHRGWKCRVVGMTLAFIGGNILGIIGPEYEDKLERERIMRENIIL
jgi:hypothetical protein